MRQLCIAVGTTLALVMLLSLVRLGTPAQAANQGMAEVLEEVASVAARSAEQQAASTTTLPSAGSSEPQADQAEVSLLPPLWLEVIADPPQALPGEGVTLTVRVHAKSELLEGMLKVALPPGLAFQGAQEEKARYEAEQHAVYCPLPVIRAGITELRLLLRMEDKAPDLAMIQVELGAAGLSAVAVGQEVVKHLFPPTEAVITPSEGGELRSADGRVQVIFPAGVVAQSVRVQHRPIQVDVLPPQG
ncbi:MAG: hypothetical protein H5T63_00075, partial [Chloroflexi bacterium]|nr:hypothetical protein [Chloroflexota bacterium]